MERKEGRYDIILPWYIFDLTEWQSFSNYEDIKGKGVSGNEIKKR